MTAGALARVGMLLLFGCADGHSKARRHERGGEWDAAVAEYEGAIRAFPNDWEAARRVASIECFRRKEAEACRRWAERLAALEPDPETAERLLVEADYLEARERLQAGDLGEARRRLRRVIEKAPDHARALYLDGVAAEKQGNREEALRAYGTAIRARPEWTAPAEARRRLSGE